MPRTLKTTPEDNTMILEEFILSPYKNNVASGSFTWSSPSNIALVKYWGKKNHQIPQNPSISFTLNNCKTTTQLHFSKKENDAMMFAFDVYLDGREQPDFKPKIKHFFTNISPYLPFLKHYYFKIETSNTFPHSSGIASSASGMSALALCLMSLERLLAGKALVSDTFFYKKASFLARLGSGSACRSVAGGLVVWGQHSSIPESTNNYGVPYPLAVHPIFKTYHDTILLVDSGSKQVSSTLGHGLMHDHPFAKSRFKQAHDQLEALITILKTGHLDRFIALIEREALSLHAMMMTSMPYFILMKPETLEIINRIWTFRKETGSKVGFTLDAGANVHLLYPESEAPKVLAFIKQSLLTYCEKDGYIQDHIGFGAKEL